MAEPPAAAQQADDRNRGQFPLPKILTYPSSTPPELITQGAEARVYKTTYLEPTIACALKHRPAKAWRHPVLDARLTRHRILSEARILAKCRREGVRVPAVYAVDEAAGCLLMEWVVGDPVRVTINEWLRRRRRRDELSNGGGNGEAAAIDGAGADDADLVALMRRVARAVGGMHGLGIVHGDLTTSNMILRPWEKGRVPPANGDARVDGGGGDGGDGLLDGDVVIIDFGLASQSTSDEDRAVDLYVLERAFASTHPRAEALFSTILGSAYRDTFKQAHVVLKKLEDVRMRGRKRSMIG
ncbi:tyrosine protein kinase [Xylariaceae sp. FL0662B]|nr:tyrosine protein kinase [Xylariaceae sp. FL0662B]